MSLLRSVGWLLGAGEQMSGDLQSRLRSQLRSKGTHPTEEMEALLTLSELIER